MQHAPSCSECGGPKSEEERWRGADLEIDVFVSFQSLFFIAVFCFLSFFASTKKTRFRKKSRFVFFFDSFVEIP